MYIPAMNSSLIRLSQMVFQLNGKPIDALAMIVHHSAVHTVGKIWTKKLKDVIPKHLFEVAIQAVVGSKIVARETISALRKGKLRAVLVDQ